MLPRRLSPLLLLPLLLTGPAACGRGDEGSPTTAAGIRWVDGFAAGAARAGSPDELLFVYVGRLHPT